MNTFNQAMAEAGLTPPNYIESDRIYRFPGIDKDQDNRAGWCKLFADTRGGVFGDWSTGLYEVWQAKRSTPFTKAETKAFAIKLKQDKQRQEIERITRQQTAAIQALKLWNEATEAKPNHPYLIAKGITPIGIRQSGRALLVPVTDGEKITSLQLIQPDGTKRFLSGGKVAGCFYIIGDTSKDKLLIAEGYATAVTLCAGSGYPVVIAFNANNLLAVSLTNKERFPNKEIILCADNDRFTEGNPGMTKATDAARAIGAKLMIPDFLPHENGTDWNDWKRVKQRTNEVGI